MDLKIRSLLLILFASLLPACNSLMATPDLYDHLRTADMQKPVEGKFTVFGRVEDQSATTVPDCQVFLINRHFDLNPKQEITPLSDPLVATTDGAGHYQFIFEPLEANDHWLSFQAAGYAPRLVDLSTLIRGDLLMPGSSRPLTVSVVLEPENQATAGSRGAR